MIAVDVPKTRVVIILLLLMRHRICICLTSDARIVEI